MLQKLSKCEVKAWLWWHFIIIPPLRFYVKSIFENFKPSKMAILTILQYVNCAPNQNSELMKLSKMAHFSDFLVANFYFTENQTFGSCEPMKLLIWQFQWVWLWIFGKFLPCYTAKNHQKSKFEGVKTVNKPIFRP